MGAEGSTGPWICGSVQLKKMGIALLPGSGAPSDGTSGTGVGKVGTGAEYVDYTNKVVWTNIGTKASPQWVVFDAILRFALSSANIIAMNGAPVTLLAAPGAGRVIIINAVSFSMTTTATAFTGGGTVNLQYTTGSVSAHTGTIPAATITAGAGTSLTQLGPLAGASGSTIVANSAISITNSTAPFATGTGSAIIGLSYEVAPTV